MLFLSGKEFKVAQPTFSYILFQTFPQCFCFALVFCFLDCLQTCMLKGEVNNRHMLVNVTRLC